MGLFSTKRDAPPASESPSSAPGRVARLWSDGFGVLATRTVQIIVVLLLAAALIVGMQQLTVVVIPVLLALIIACAFWPLTGWLRARMPSLLATVITLASVLVVLGGLGWIITSSVRNQWSELYDQAQTGISHFLDWVGTLPFSIDQSQIDEWITQTQDFVTSSQFGSGALAGVSAVANFVTGLVLFVVVLFFFLKDGPRLWEFVIRPFRGEADRRVRRIGDKSVQVFGSYVRGTAAVAAVDAIGILIGLLILQVPLAIPLAVLVFVLAFIPIVGATLAGILAAAVALVANGWVSALLVVGVVVLVNQLEGNLLQPVLMGRSMKLHAFAILIALTIGTVLGGVLGAILAVPITAVVWGAIQVWDGPHTPARWARPKPGRE